MRLPVLAFLALSAGGESCDFLLGPSTCSETRLAVATGQLRDSASRLLGSVTFSVSETAGDRYTYRSLVSTFDGPDSTKVALAQHAQESNLVTVVGANLFSFTVSGGFQATFLGAPMVTESEASRVRDAFLSSDASFRLRTDLAGIGTIITPVALVSSTPWKRSCYRT